MLHCRVACFFGVLAADFFHFGASQDDEPAKPDYALVTDHTASQLQDAIRACKGPYAVFLTGGDEAELQARVHFAGAAAQFGDSNVACFSLFRCDQNRDFCLDLNIRRTPAVLIYPPHSGPVQMLTGKIEREEISEHVAKIIRQGDRSVMLTEDTIKLFLMDIMRPVKVILFSGRKASPSIFQALSSDPDLWPHVRFGFVKHTEKALLQLFGVTEVPHMILQHGALESTRESLRAVGMPIDEIRQWIRERVLSSAEDPGEVGLFQAARGASLFEEEADIDQQEYDEELADEASSKTSPAPSLAGKSSPSPGPKPKPGGKKTKPGTSKPKSHISYRVMEAGRAGCPHGHEITTVEECFKAVDALGKQAQPPWIATYPGLPRFCSIREAPSATAGNERMHFNSNAQGQGREDLSPICKFVIQPGSEPEVAASARRDPIPELTALSQDTLLGTEGFSFVYLSDGRIQDDEVAMLVDLKEQFKLQLEHQGTKMGWMWMDLRMERKWKNLFDPPTLPSAVVLSPHKRPRYAMLTHGEDVEGEHVPAEQTSLALLLNTVLGGDAHFSNLPQKYVDRFAERSSG